MRPDVSQRDCNNLEVSGLSRTLAAKMEKSRQIRKMLGGRVYRTW